MREARHQESISQRCGARREDDQIGEARLPFFLFLFLLFLFLFALSLVEGLLPPKQDRFDELSANGEWVPSFPASFLSPRAPRLRETISSSRLTNPSIGPPILKALQNHLALARRRSDGPDTSTHSGFAHFAPLREFSVSLPQFRTPPSPIPDSDSRFPLFVTQPRLFPSRRPEMCLFARRQGKISAPRLASTRQAEAHTYI